MSKQEIIDRILADADAESSSIVAEAEAKASKMLADAEAYAANERAETKLECEAYAKDVMEKRQAAARLECAKIELAAKRKVLDYAYTVALSKLKERSLEEPTAFYAWLLEKYAETDDVVYFAKDFAYVDAVAKLPVFAAKSLTVASERADIDGGVLLVGKKADKDVSLAALIARDKELNLSKVAAEIFESK